MEDVQEEDDQSTKDTSLPHCAAPSSPVSTVSAAGHLPTDTMNNDTNADCAFLNDVQDIFQKHSGKTSHLFLPFLCQMKDTVKPDVA